MITIASQYFYIKGFIVLVYVCLCVCMPCVQGCRHRPKRHPIPWRLELEEVYEPADMAIENPKLLEEHLVAELSLQSHIKIFYRF